MSRRTNFLNLFTLYILFGALRADMGPSNGNVGLDDGHFNGDGVVSATDYLRLRANLLGNFPALTPAQSFMRGDITHDRRVDHADFAAFREAYLAANGQGAFEAMVAQVPEPAAAVMAAMLLALGYVMRRGTTSFERREEARAHSV